MSTMAYKNLNITSAADLLKIEGRFICLKCKSSRKFFCYKCSSKHPDYEGEIPKIELPLQIDIIKHKQEVFGKSTSSHAKIIAPNHVSIYEYPDIPDYSMLAPDEVILIFPSTNSVSISSLFKGVSSSDFKKNHGLEKGFNIGTMLTKSLDEILSDEAKERLALDEQMSDRYSLSNLPIKRAVFIDSTWNQCRGIYKDPRVSSIKSCVIQNRITKFWRHQKGSPNWYLATIEAIHQFLLEVHVSAWGISRSYYDKCLGDLQLDASFIPPSKIITDEPESSDLCKPYSGQYDNILFFFSFLHSLINSMEQKNGPLNLTPINGATERS